MADTYAVMREYLDHILAGEWDQLADFFSDDFVGHVGGHSRFSGTHQGKDAFGQIVGDMVGSMESYRTDEHDLLVSDDHAVVLGTWHAEREGKSISMNRVVIYHLDGNKITELWVLNEDQAAADEFIA